MLRTLASTLGTTLLCLLLASCGPVYERQDIFTPPPDPEGRMCVQSCQQTQQSCRSNCERAVQQCELRAERDAALEYSSYILRRQAEGQSIDRSLASFTNTSHCRRERQRCEANCADAHRLCYTNCGGHVRTEQTCVMFCGER